MNKRISRACVFIDSSNPSMPSQVINGAQPFIKPPFPPTIEARDLLKKARDGSLTKAPNAFIIYRKLFIETARSDGYYLPMTVISSMSSQSWEREPEEVKAAYKRLAKEAFNLRNEMLPKSIRRRKREKWNIVTFDDEEDKIEPRSGLVKTEPTTPTLKQKSANKDSLKAPPNKQLLLSPISSPEPLSIESTPTITPIFSPMISPSSPSSLSNEKLAQIMIPSPTRSTFSDNFIDEDGFPELNNWFTSSQPSSIGSEDEQYLLSPTFEIYQQFDLIQDPPSYLDGLGIHADNLFNTNGIENHYQDSGLFQSQDLLYVNESYKQFYY